MVLVSLMEHHANDLPHRRHAGQVVHLPLTGVAPALGAIDLTVLEQYLEQYRGRVNYLAVSAASNVTGIVNPVHDIAALAHAFGAWVVVDASQSLAHLPLPLSGNGSRIGAGRRGVFGPQAARARVAGRGGDAADAIGRYRTGRSRRWHGGRCAAVRLPGDRAVSRPRRGRHAQHGRRGATGRGAESPRRVDMTQVHAAEQQQLRRLLAGLSALPGARVYGDLDLQRTPRLGTVAFNLDGLEHGLVAAVLNDYFNVAVRNGCFCAHPYVRELLKPGLWTLDVDLDAENAAALLEPWQGMVRASLGLSYRDDDIEALLTGVRELLARPDHYRALYRSDAGGHFRHRTFAAPAETLFDPEAALDRVLARLNASNDML